MSWGAVRTWRDRLRASDLSRVDAGVSPEGLREALDAALDALSDAALDEVAGLGLRPFPTASVVTAATVSTAAVEWLAVLLGRGSRVLLKASTRAPGLAPLLVREGAAIGLPVELADREAALTADLVVAMGSDATLARIRERLRPGARLLPHGHRFSAAWVTGAPLPDDPLVPEAFRDPWGRVAADAALHDGRGCLSPVVVLTPLPLEEAAEGLGAALARAEARWPRGRVDAHEAAGIRTRRALARVTGRVAEGAGWSVHALPADRWVPGVQPRSLALVHATNPEEARRVLAPWRRALSTVGTDDPATASRWIDVGATRVCATGRMQRPPLVRAHDGEDWLRATGIAVSVEV